jgi:anti-sigma B factor antagonist
MKTFLSVEEEKEENAVIRFLQLSVRLDSASTEVMAKCLSSLLEGRGPSRFVLDFGPVEFVTSETLGLLVRWHKRLAATGGYLTLVNVREEVYEVFEVTKLTQLLHVHRGYG